jgi:hypothetical protein
VHDLTQQEFVLGRVKFGQFSSYTNGFAGLTIRSQRIAFAAGACVASVSVAAEVGAKTLLSFALVDVDTGAPIYAKIKATAALAYGAFGGFSAFLGAWIVALDACSFCKEKIRSKIMHL